MSKLAPVDWTIFLEAFTLTLAEPQLQTLLEQAAQAVNRPNGKGGDTLSSGIDSSCKAFADLILATADEQKLAARGQILTENGALTHGSSGSACLDFFFNVLETTPSESVRQFLEKAWQEQPEDTLKLVAQLRDVRNGKADVASAHECMSWLFRRSPLTVVANLEELAKVGYWKDLLIILARQCVGETVWADRKQAAEHRKTNKGANIPASKEGKKKRKREWRQHLHKLASELKADTGSEEKLVEAKVQEAKTARAAELAEAARKSQEDASTLKKSNRTAEYENARKVANTDPAYRLLHVAVAVIFAQQLQQDRKALDDQADKAKVSLAAKWAPSPGASFDNQTLIASTIAQLLYPTSQHRAEGENYPHYIWRARIMYQKQYLKPLRAHMKLPEVYMSAQKWDELDYGRVASVCMKLNKKTFQYHDKERFVEYLGQVKRGEKKIAAGALKPHELVKEVMQQPYRYFGDPSSEHESEHGSDADSAKEQTEKDSSEVDNMLEVVELQWKAYVEQLKQSGTLAQSMAIADVSGSMAGLPMEVAIALSLLTAEVTAPPFNQLICTFSSTPELHQVKGKTLQQKVYDVQGMWWNTNTNFGAVFKLLLDRAKAANLEQKDMIKTLFVFSDMEFDQATASSKYDYITGKNTQVTTNHEAITAEFEQAGYKLPRIVYWNVAGREREHGRPGASIPVTQKEDGTALVSGFSGMLLKLFMSDALETFTPMSVMQAAIAERYDKWVLVGSK